MNVGELRKFLAEYPSDMPIIYMCFGSSVVYDSIITTSPGADLLDRIIRARDVVNSSHDDLPWQAACQAREAARSELMDALDELGGGHDPASY